MEHARNVRIESMIGDFFKEHQLRMEHYEAEKIDEVVYSNKAIDPLGTEGSITIAHTFYGVFEVVSLLSRTSAGISHANGRAPGARRLLGVFLKNVPFCRESSSPFLEFRSSGYSGQWTKPLRSNQHYD